MFHETCLSKLVQGPIKDEVGSVEIMACNGTGSGKA